MFTELNSEKLQEIRLPLPACFIKQTFWDTAKKDMKGGHSSLCFMFFFTRYCCLLIIAEVLRNVYLYCVVF